MSLIRSLRDRLRDSRKRRAFPELYDDAVQMRHLAEIAGLMRGGSVAVVGNAAAIFDRQDGAEIDGHDRVVRINRGFVRDPAAQGGRTDLLCLGTLVEPEAIETAFGRPPIVFVSPQRWGLSDSPLRGREHVACFPLGAWRELSARIGGGRPSAGLITVFMCRETFGFEAVSLFGFDWKTTKTFYASKLRTNHHDWEAERALMRSWASEGWLRLPPIA